MCLSSRPLFALIALALAATPLAAQVRISQVNGAGGNVGGTLGAGFRRR
jgi:hypothetical protein